MSLIKPDRNQNFGFATTVKEQNYVRSRYSNNFKEKNVHYFIIINEMSFQITESNRSLIISDCIERNNKNHGVGKYWQANWSMGIISTPTLTSLPCLSHALSLYPERSVLHVGLSLFLWKKRSMS